VTTLLNILDIRFKTSSWNQPPCKSCDGFTVTLFFITYFLVRCLFPVDVTYSSGQSITFSFWLCGDKRSTIKLIPEGESFSIHSNAEIRRISLHKEN
jgi:hypothetical protein